MLAKNLGTHLVWCQPIISSLARFQKFLVTCQNFGYNDQFLGMNQMIAKFFLACLDFGMAKIGSKTKQTLSPFPNSNDGDYSRTLLVQYIYSTIGGMCLNDLLRLEGTKTCIRIQR